MDEDDPSDPGPAPDVRRAGCVVKRLTLLAVVAATALVPGVTVGPAGADEDGGLEPGEIVALEPSSDGPGQPPLSWQTPEPAPSDYRLVWAPEDETLPSWRDEHEPHRGNSDPDGETTSLTLRHAGGQQVRAQPQPTAGKSTDPAERGADPARNEPGSPARDNFVILDDDPVPQSQQSESEVVFVSNMDEPTTNEAGHWGSFFHSSSAPKLTTGSFTTGPGRYGMGYRLTGITVNGRNRSVSHFNTVAELQIRNENNGAPGGVLHTLGPIANFAPHRTYSPQTFTASEEIILLPRTTYWAVFRATTFGTVGVQVTYSRNDTPNGDPGFCWSIGDGGGYQFQHRHAPHVWRMSTGTPMLAIHGVPAWTAAETSGDSTLPVQSPATGTPVVKAANVFRVPAVLSVDLGEIIDANGLTRVDDCVTYNWQRFDATGTSLEADGIGAGPTYTLTDADAGKRIKVQVRLTDDVGFIEGPLTSAAYPISGSVAAQASCPAPSYAGGAEQIWRGKVSVAAGDTEPRRYGYEHSEGGNPSGSLDRPRFTTEHSNTHRVLYAYTQRVTEAGVDRDRFSLGLDQSLAPADKRTLAFHVCDQTYALNDGSSNAQFVFDHPGQDWSPYAARTLFLSQDIHPPTIASSTTDGDRLVLTFSEELGEAEHLANSAFTVRRTPLGGSEQVVPLSGEAPPVIRGRTVTLSPASPIAPTDTELTVTYSRPRAGAANRLIDRFGNEVASFVDRRSTNLISDLERPRPETTSPAVLADDGFTLTLSFNEPLKQTSIPAREDFRLYVGSEIVEIGRVVVSGSTVTLTLAVPARAGQAIVLDYTPGAAPIRDLAGLSAEPISGLRVDNGSKIGDRADRSPPRLTGATANANLITLLYDEELDPAFLPATADFTVTQNSRRIEVDRISISGSTVTLSLTQPLTSDATVTVIYSPGSNPIRDLAGNAMPRGNHAASAVVTASSGGRSGGGGPPPGPTPSDIDFEWTVDRDIDELDGDHDFPTGCWSDGAILWILHNAGGADDAVYAYDLESGERTRDREFDLDERNRAPRGVWSDRVTLWVSDSGQNRLYAHDLESGERLPERDIVLAERNRDARGIWSDGATIWVLDGGKNSLFAYALPGGDPIAEYALDDANSDPRGIWSDRTTVWVSDDGAKRLFAYRLPPAGPAPADAPRPALERVRDEEFPNTVLSGASNNSPRGLWSDGDVMYVADESDDRVYSYNMPDAIDARLASLSLSGVDIGEFDPGRTEYEAVVADGVTEATVEAEAMQSRTTVVIDPEDADTEANGHQAALRDLAEVTVTVTSRDGSRMKTYRVRFPETTWDPARDPWPRCLRGAVSEGLSLVLYEGGSVEELVTCAESRGVGALYALHEGAYLSYILGAPGFVNRSFAEVFAGGVPPVTPLVARSDGPPSADPFGDGFGEGGVLWPWPECLRGEIAAGLSLVVYEGGGLEELVACAGSMGVTAVYALQEGVYLSYILGAPAFVNRDFAAVFADGLPLLTPLVARSE